MDGGAMSRTHLLQGAVHRPELDLDVVLQCVGGPRQLRLGLLAVSAPGRVEHDQVVLLLLEGRLEVGLVEVLDLVDFLRPGDLRRGRRRRLLRVRHELDDGLLLPGVAGVERLLAVLRKTKPWYTKIKVMNSLLMYSR